MILVGRTWPSLTSTLAPPLSQPGPANHLLLCFVICSPRSPHMAAFHPLVLRSTMESAIIPSTYCNIPCVHFLNSFCYNQAQKIRKEHKTYKLCPCLILSISSGLVSLPSCLHNRLHYVGASLSSEVGVMFGLFKS